MILWSGEANMSDKNYWIVGAMFGGDDDNLDDFLIRGYWYCWDRNTPHNIPSGGQGNSVEAQQSRLLQIKAGDRIAVKKIKSITNQEMEIRAIGIVKDVDFNEWRIYVKWLPIIDNDIKIVALKGCVASVHGPFKRGDAWINEIFCV